MDWKEEKSTKAIGEIFNLKIGRNRPGMVAHACNSNYLGGGDQEDCSSKPAQEKVSQTLSQSINQVQ
jgi:hypothetical protein